ncbi:hypothetical protein J6590_106803 [Homalodisca vitripennis]|nr:hypothetical protein J6590_106803 [Homalodisca vitripennis]
MRWLLSGYCAERAIKMMHNLNEYKTHLVEKEPGAPKPPDTHSYNVITRTLNEKLLTAKLAFFSYISSLVKPFLKYQAIGAFFSTPTNPEPVSRIPCRPKEAKCGNH